jgi:hypothetical protein
LDGIGGPGRCSGGGIGARGSAAVSGAAAAVCMAGISGILLLRNRPFFMRRSALRTTRSNCITSRSDIGSP